MVNVGNEEPATVVGNLRKALAEIDELSAERASIEEALKEERNRDNILPKLMANSGRSDNIFTEELKKYDELKVTSQSPYTGLTCHRGNVIVALFTKGHTGSVGSFRGLPSCRLCLAAESSVLVLNMATWSWAVTHAAAILQGRLRMRPLLVEQDVIIHIAMTTCRHAAPPVFMASSRAQHRIFTAGQTIPYTMSNRRSHVNGLALNLDGGLDIVWARFWERS